MTTYLKILFSGFAISFIGALPFGTINLTALQLSIERGTPDAIYFAIAVVMMELVIVRCLLLLKPIDINGISQKWHVYVLSIFALIMFFLSAMNVYNIFTPSSTQGISNSTFAIPSSFLLGLVISGFNPFQFPYWIGWNSALRSKKLLQDTRYSRIFLSDRYRNWNDGCAPTFYPVWTVFGAPFTFISQSALRNNGLGLCRFCSISLLSNS